MVRRVQNLDNAASTGRRGALLVIRGVDSSSEGQRLLR